MKKCKNITLTLLIFISQIHTLFIGCGFNFVWLINNKVKSASFSVFLFTHYFSVMFILYCALKPKYINKNILFFLFLISILDFIFFIINSNYNVGIYKMVLSVLIFVFFKSKFNKWISF